MAGRMVDGRTIREPAWPAGGMVTKPMDDRNWDVQAFTGRPVSSIPEGRWNRGYVVRFMTPDVHPNVGPLYMNDPTDPTRYVLAVTPQRRRGLIRGRK